LDDQERIGEDLFTLILKFPVYDPLPNPLMRGEVLVFVRPVRRASPRLASFALTQVLLVATLGFRMEILSEKPQEFKGEFCENR
jgi:hypothetical protein